MKIRNLFIFLLIFICSKGFCDNRIQEIQNLGIDKNAHLEYQPKKFFIGLELKTNHEECSLIMLAHKNRFFKENILSKIPNKINKNILALYTGYEGDNIESCSWILGCEVSNLEQIPEGLIGKIIPESNYVVFTTQEELPQGLITLWENVKKSDCPRSYQDYFELHQSDFDPQKTLKVKICLALEDPLLKFLQQGRLEAFRSASLYSPLPEADFKETSHNYLYAWGMDYVCGNGIIEKNACRHLTNEEIDEAIKYFSAKNLPFMWWTSAKILETKGFQFGGVLRGIARDFSQPLPAQPPLPSNLKIKTVQTETELKDFINISADAFAMNSKAAKQWLSLNESAMKKAEQIHFIAYLNEKAIGAVTLSLSSDSAGIWNLATISEHRKQGIGAALVYAALVEAKKKHCNQVIAILMPKGLAWGLLTKMGFRSVCEFPFYVYGVSAEELEN